MPVILRLRGLFRFSDSVQRHLKGPNHGGPIGVAFKQWGAVYRGFVKERFHRFSRGSGDWPPLKPSTIARRRKGTGVGTVAILIDTGTLFAGLDPSLKTEKGAIQKDIRNGIRVGYGGSARHEKGGGTIAAIASYHQAGGGRLPKREIIVKPDSATIAKMAKLMRDAIEKEWRDSTRSAG
jgi:hypothetical protein